MGTSFSPSTQDVERYIRLRALGSDLLQRFANTVPRHVFIEIGKALGLLRNGVPELGSEHISNVLADCCMFEWLENGKNLVQRYAETHPPAPRRNIGCWGCNRQWWMPASIATIF